MFAAEKKKLDFSLKAVLKWHFYFSTLIVLSVDDDSDENDSWKTLREKSWHREMPYSHSLCVSVHSSCLRSWLEQDTSCPTCRKMLNISGDGGQPRNQQQGGGGGLEDNMGPAGPPADARPHINQHNHFFHFDGQFTRHKTKHESRWTLDSVLRSLDVLSQDLALPAGCPVSLWKWCTPLTSWASRRPTIRSSWPW